MASYAELMAQAKALMEQAEKSKRAERAEALAAIKAKMAEYGITAADLGGATRAGKAAKVKGEAKYRGPNGELWSGKGRRPAWANEALAAGKSLNDFAI
ncbi:H-NS family nucleoid-associated regulatory protein [Hydrogenophaga defluvii]|uniref:H-NS family nucleoid-associated regulatory protein n=2 Tax=Hydrogenophaga defluvii TaxID=249410 RepID=A0ABW2SF94_9BURK